MRERRGVCVEERSTGYVQGLSTGGWWQLCGSVGEVGRKGEGLREWVYGIGIRGGWGLGTRMGGGTEVVLGGTEVGSLLCEGAGVV
jgi:hypothetical protein